VTGCPVFMHPCCNESSGSIQHSDFLTDRATELYSKVLNIIPVPNTHCQLSKNPGPNCATSTVLRIVCIPISSLPIHTSVFHLTKLHYRTFTRHLSLHSVRPNPEPATHPPATAASPCSTGRRDCLAETRTAALAWWWLSTLCLVQLKCDGTRSRTGGEVKGKLAIGVGSQYPSRYLGTWCIQRYNHRCAHLGCQ